MYYICTLISIRLANLELTMSSKANQNGCLWRTSSHMRTLLVLILAVHVSAINSNSTVVMDACMCV